jgi:hypothetical protein
LATFVLELSGSRLSRGRCRRGACLVSRLFPPGAAAALTSLPVLCFFSYPLFNTISLLPLDRRHCNPSNAFAVSPSQSGRGNPSGFFGETKERGKGINKHAGSGKRLSGPFGTHNVINDGRYPSTTAPESDSSGRRLTPARCWSGQNEEHSFSVSVAAESRFTARAHDTAGQCSSFHRPFNLPECTAAGLVQR